MSHRSQCQDLPTEGVPATAVATKTTRDVTDFSSADAATEFDFQYLEIELPRADNARAVTDMSKFKHSLPLYPVSKIL